MANLIRLLLALPASDLRRMAEQWGLAVEPEPRALIASVYHEMTAEWPVKTLWERLTPAEQLVLQTLLRQRDAVSPASALVHQLPLDAATFHQAIHRLGRWGVVGYWVGGTDVGYRPAPPAQPVNRWSAYVPMDLAGVLRRLCQQIDQASRNEPTLRKLLIALTLGELVHLAARWGIAQPERFFKRELVRMLEELLTQREVVHARLATAPIEARRLCQAVLDTGGRLAVDAARGSTGLDGERLRTAFDHLHELFLLHETYTVRNQRLFYVPNAVLQGERQLDQPAQLPPLVLVGRPPVPVPPDGTFLHDLAKLLARVAFHPPHARSRSRDVTVHSLSLAEVVSPTEELHTTIRAWYIQHCALRLGLLGLAEGRLLATSLITNWLQLGEEAQVVATFRLWLSEERCPGMSGSEHLKPAVALPVLRRALLGTLSDVETGAWYSLNSLMRRLRAQLRLVSPLGRDGGHPELRHAAVFSLYPLHWLGLLTLGASVDGKLVAFQRNALANVVLAPVEPGGTDAGTGRDSSAAEIPYLAAISTQNPAPACTSSPDGDHQQAGSGVRRTHRGHEEDRLGE
ncbi:MAG: hypothetical protein HYY04_16785 [Chloroflexi bacterium]|nr:hypothetical protein [Chloroflexota bacterium]